jgi:GntR family transcriptional regulator, transcriptional repressor for pyruvate dehydrogenase complex
VSAHDSEAGPGPDPEEHRTEKLSERLACQIVEDISAAVGGRAAGMKLPSEAEMAAHYAVGRGTVREALRMLEVQGLITIKCGPGGGPVVTGGSPRRLGASAAMHLQLDGVTLASVADARLVFEPFFARQAARRASREDKDRLMAMVDEASFAGDNERADLRRASAFHTAVMDCAGNSVVTLLGACLKELWTGTFRGQLYPMHEQPRVRGDHLAIAQAIASGDADEAERLMQTHMEEFVSYARERFAALLEETVSWR